MSKRFPRIIAVFTISVLAVSSICLSIVGMSQAVFADGSDANTIMKKTLLNGLSTCYNDEYMRSSFQPSALGNSIANIFTSKAFGTDGSTKVIKLPNNVGNTSSSASISCKELFIGGGGVSGLFSFFGRDKSMSPDEKRNALLKDLGYTINETSEDSGGSRCISVSYETGANGQYSDATSTNSICVNVVDGVVDFINSYSGMTVEQPLTSPLYLDYDISSQEIILYADATRGQVGLVSNELGRTHLSPDERVSWDEFKARAEEDLNLSLASDGINSYRAKPEFTNGSSETFAEAVRGSNAALDALHFFSGEPNATFTTYSFTTQDKYALYTAYLNEELAKNSNVLLGSTSECKASLDAVKSVTGYAVRNGGQWCPLYGVTASGSYNIIETPLNNKLVTGTFKDVIEALMGLDYSYLESMGVQVGTLEGGQMSGGAETGNPGGETTEAGEKSTIAACYDGSGALGWIVCPVIEIVGSATGWLYENAVEPSLQIKASSLFSSTNGIYTGWATFRNFSNVLFAVAFAVIILAQVTGIGISNYNVKKILPRFVMVVVLVNLSYIFCQLAVDVSNIVGSSVKSLLEGLPVAGSKATGGEIAIALTNGLGLAVGTGVVVNLALSSAVVVAGLKYFMVPIVLSLIGCLLGVIFFFVTMAVRQAGVVILVVLSPVAIVCYALPNTKSIFDKWKKMFTALLIVYPVCGLLMGGGTYAGALLLSVGEQTGGEMGLFYTITAMLLSIIPFFMIPSLVKGSMAMMGNLGMKISNFGNGISRGLRGGIANSRMVKEHQAEEQRRLELARNKTRVGRYSNEPGKGGGLVGRARRAIGMNEKLSRRAQIKNAQALENVDKITGASANAMSIGWENSGRANDFEWLREQYEDATDKLLENPYDYEALELQKAASAQLAKTKPGRAELYAANQKIGEKVAMINAGTDEQAKINARQTMLRTGNNLMRSSSGDIARSPLVAEQIKAFQDTNTDYEKLDGTVLTESINGLNERTVTELGSKDLKAYEKAISQNRLSSAQIQKLSSIVGRALRNPHLQDAFKDENLSALNKIANYQYDSPVGQHEQMTKGNNYTIDKTATKAYSGITAEDLGRIHNQIRTKGLDGAERDNVLRNLGDTLMRSIDDSDTEVQLKPEQAARISEILQDNNFNMDTVRDAYGYTADQLKDKLDMATGIKVTHSAPISGPAQGPYSPQPAPPIVVSDGRDLSMDAMREIARNNPVPGSGSGQNNGQNGNGQSGNGGNPPIILT